jgi:hypothetical protein
MFCVAQRCTNQSASGRLDIKDAHCLLSSSLFVNGALVEGARGPHATQCFIKVGEAAVTAGPGSMMYVSSAKTIGCAAGCVAVMT